MPEVWAYTRTRPKSNMMTRKTIRKVLKLYAQGMTLVDIAKEMRYSFPQISNCVKNHHLTEIDLEIASKALSRISKEYNELTDFSCPRERELSKLDFRVRERMGYESRLPQDNEHRLC